MKITLRVLLSTLPWVFTALCADWPFDEKTITAPDGSITARFVSIGATLTELWVKDKQGRSRDVVLGYDDNSKLWSDPIHLSFNGIVGRYANRIKNGTFSIPISKNPTRPNVYHTPKNDGTGRHTLAGGVYGWDRRNWTVVSQSATSLTYKHLDTGDEGFPGNVTVYATHTVSNKGALRTKIHARATQKTPIMLTQHIYWNLDAFQDDNVNVIDHKLQVHSSKVLQLDGDSIPTGKLLGVTNTSYDFRKPRRIGDLWNSSSATIDNCLIYDKSPPSARPKLTISSEQSGIQLDVHTNQPAVQLFASFFFDFVNLTRKEAHGGPTKTYGAWSGIAIEQEGYIGAINTPEFGVDQIYHPGRDYHWDTTYRFSVST